MEIKENEKGKLVSERYQLNPNHRTVGTHLNYQKDQESLSFQ